jgi:hypothetical protein
MGRFRGDAAPSAMRKRRHFSRQEQTNVMKPIAHTAQKMTRIQFAGEAGAAGVLAKRIGVTKGTLSCSTANDSSDGAIEVAVCRPKRLPASIRMENGMRIFTDAAAASASPRL